MSDRSDGEAAEHGEDGPSGAGQPPSSSSSSPVSSPPPRQRGIPSSPDWNYQAHIIAPPLGGKTVLARRLVYEHLAAGGFAFVHDPTFKQYKDLCVYFADAKAIASAGAAAVRERRPLPRGVACGGDVDALVDLLIELGELHGPRVKKLLVIDEGSLITSSGPSWIAASHNELLSRRRHLGIGPLFLQQRIAQLGRQFYEMATDVYVFRLGNPDGLENLEKYLNLPPGTLVSSVPRLPDFAHVHAVNGKGLV